MISSTVDWVLIPLFGVQLIMCNQTDTINDFSCSGDKIDAKALLVQLGWDGNVQP
jgi:hypothetical protein